MKEFGTSILNPNRIIWDKFKRVNTEELWTRDVLQEYSFMGGIDSHHWLDDEWIDNTSQVSKSSSKHSSSKYSS